jgi:hypothetical protein
LGGFFGKSGTVFPVQTWQFGFMDKKTNNGQQQQGRHEHPLPQEISDEQRALNESAHEEAEKDMEDDAEFTASSPNDDLDEGETARLGEDTNLI